MGATPTETRSTDDELAARIARRGDQAPASGDAEAAFAQLYDRHARPLAAFLAARAVRSDVDDLCQETWRKVWRRLPGGFHGGNFRAWLFEIARNVQVDHNRKRRPELLGDGDVELPDPPSQEPADALAESEHAEAMRRCLAKLAANASALVRARLGGEDYEGVRGRLGLSANSAYKLFHKAKRQLRDCLERSLR